MLLVLSLLGCGDGVRAPKTTILSEGTGAANEEPLLALMPGTVLSTEDSELRHPYSWALEAPTERGGAMLYRMVFPDGTFYLEQQDDGVYLHGSHGGLFDRPTLFLPDSVRVGMKWESVSSKRSDALVTEVVSMEERETGFGLRRVWGIERTLPGEEGRTAYYAEGIGLVEGGVGVTHRAYTQGLVRTAPARREPLDPAADLTLTSLNTSFPGAAAHVSLMEDDAGGRVLSVHTTFLEASTLQLPGQPPITIAAWADGRVCHRMNGEAIGESVTSVACDRHAGLVVPGGSPLAGDGDAAFGRMPAITEGITTVHTEYAAVTDRGAALVGPQYGEGQHLRRAAVIDGIAQPVSDSWISDRYLRVVEARSASRAVADPVADADGVDVLLEDGLGGWTWGSTDENALPTGPTRFAFRKVGIPHLHATPTGREGLITDADGYVWRTRLGGTTPDLELLGHVDLPEGHRLAGAARLAAPNGAVGGTTLLVATVSGFQRVIISGQDELPDDTSETHLWTTSLTEATSYDTKDGLIGVSTGAGVWVCGPDSATTATNLEPQLGSDDTFASCRRFVSRDAAVTEAGAHLLSGPIPRSPAPGDQPGGMGDDGRYTDLRTSFSTTGMAVDAAPWSALVREGSGAVRTGAFRDPWLLDVYAWDYDFNVFDRLHVTLDGVAERVNGTLPDTWEPSRRAAGGGGRIVEIDGERVLRTPEGELPLPETAIVAWSDGRYCHAPGERALSCVGSDGVERSRVVNGLPLFNRMRFDSSAWLADADDAYIAFADHLWRLDPDTMELEPMAPVHHEAPDGSTLDGPLLNLHQGEDGAIWFMASDGELTVVLDGEVAKTGVMGPHLPFLDDTVIGADGSLVDVARTPVDPVYESPPEGTPFGSSQTYRIEVGVTDVPAVGAVAPVVPSTSPFVFAGTTVLPFDEEVVFDADGDGFVAVRPEGLVDVAFDGTEVVSPWTGSPREQLTDVPLIGPDRTHLVVFEALDALPEGYERARPVVIDLADRSETVVGPSLLTVSDAADFVQLTADNRTLFTLEFESLPSLLEWDDRFVSVDLATGATTVVSEDISSAFPTGGSDPITRRVSVSPSGSVMAVSDDVDPDWPTTLLDVATGERIARLTAEVPRFAPAGGGLYATGEMWSIAAGPVQVGVGWLGRTERFALHRFGPTGERVRVEGRDAATGANPMAVVSRANVDGQALDLWVDGLWIDRPNATVQSAADVIWSPDGRQFAVVADVYVNNVLSAREAIRFSR